LFTASTTERPVETDVLLRIDFDQLDWLMIVSALAAVKQPDSVKISWLCLWIIASDGIIGTQK